MTHPGEPDALDLAVQRARKRFDTAHRDLMAAIDAELAAGRGPSRIARHAGYSREHIAKMRDDGKLPASPRWLPPRTSPGA